MQVHKSLQTHKVGKETVKLAVLLLVACMVELLKFYAHIVMINTFCFLYIQDTCHQSWLY